MADSPGLNQDEINPDEMISCDLYEGMVRLEADAAIVATSEWLNLVVMVQSQEAIAWKSFHTIRGRLACSIAGSVSRQLEPNRDPGTSFPPARVAIIYHEL